MPPRPNPSQFEFKNTKAAAQANYDLLKAHDFDLAQILEKEHNTVTSPAYEFRPREVVEPLLDLSSDATKLKRICFEGIRYPFRNDVDLSDATRIGDIKYWLKKGNNKSARGKTTFIQDAITKEIERGWQIAIPRDKCLDIKGLNLVPASVAQKFTHVDEHGIVHEKDRLAHDCTQPAQSGQSVNNMIDDEVMEECHFGNVLTQVVHEVHALRTLHPATPILLSKYDLDAAYRRLSVAINFALLCAMAVADMVYICFRLCFGAKPAPALFSLVSKFVAELAQALCLDETWDPKVLQSGMLDAIDTTPIFRTGDFAPAAPLMFEHIPAEISIRVFIDDLITITLALPDLILRAIHAVPLVLDAVFRPNFVREFLNRNPILSQKKLWEEGILAERQVILGWLIDTRLMKLFITTQKAKRLLIDIKNMLVIGNAKTVVPRKALESLIGKLTDISYIIPEGRFFLNRLRYRHKVIPRGRTFNRFDNMEIKDLNLWMTIVHNLTDGNIGRSTNAILETIACILVISDACEHGLGGLIIINGIAFAWRFELPMDLVGIFSINLLEFIGSYWGIKRVCQFVRNIKMLTISDSTNSLAWLTANKHNPHLQPMHDDVARAVGKSLIEADNSLLKGHIDGIKNKITDSFSRDTNIEFEHLINLLKQHPETRNMLPEQVSIFEENGDELCSWLRSLAQNNPLAQESVKEQRRSGLFTGDIGLPSAQKSAKRTSFCETSQLEATLQVQATFF